LRPIVLVILILLAVFIACIYQLQDRQIESRVHERIARVKSLLREYRVADSRLLRGIADCLQRDGELLRYWRAGDRSALLAYSKPYFDELRSRYQITHLYFHRPDQVCFLRVHDPNRYGDRIDRVTMERAAKEDDSSWGLELGPLGTFALRVVHPWKVQDELVGYIELGEEIDRIVTMVKQVLDVELVVAADKSYLDRSAWEEGMRMLGRRANWDLLPALVVNDHTFGPTVSQPLVCAVLSAERGEDKLFEQTIEGKRYRGGIIVLSDAADRPVGRVVVLCDIGAEKASLRLLLFMLLDLSAVVAVAIAVLFGRFIRDIERRLTAVYADLRTEIQKRTSAEEELRQHRDNLEDLVGQRTVELETANQHLSQEITERVAAQNSLRDLNEELQNTVARLDVANSDLKNFLRVAAHDLKAPIRAVGTLVDWIRDDCEDKISESGKAYLDLLLNRAQRLSRHIDRILEYSEISSGTGPARRVDLNGLVREVIATLPRPQGITVVVENELPTLMADRTRMAQIFENLLSNAVRYMDRPTGVVRVGCTAGRSGWTFHVSDTGPGIEEKFFSKIFQMFQTLSPRDEVEATGMGLPIVKRIVELYGGTIWVESAVGRGSTFFFTLPLQTPQTSAEPQEAAVARL
jgi:signal transduction histidine kinase